MTAPNPAALVGARLNQRWQLVKLLGEGGMGAVYEADGLAGEGKRAIKILHQEYVGEVQILQRFFTEAQAAQALRHPNVAQILETATAENGTPYLVMELLVGTPVSAYVDAAQALPPAQAVHIAHGVLQALGHAHSRGIIHRDIKPDNLFLVRDNNGSFSAKVLDFGIAKVMDAAGGMGQKTRTGVLLGTPGYMSPEQIKNSKGVDGRADLWSVGIIFYELLTGISPFPAANEFARLTSVLTEEVRPIGEIAPHLALWATFFQRALQKDPNLRFQTADEMAAALLQAARGVSMRPPPTLQGPQAPSTTPDWRTPAPPSARPSVPPHMTPPSARPPLASSAPQTTPMAVMPSGFDRPSAIQPSPVSAQQYAGTLERPSAIQPSPVSAQAAAYAAMQQGTSGIMSSPMSVPVSVPVSVAAVSQGSIPPPRNATIASAPDGALPAQVSANALAGIGPTHVSAQRPAGTPPVQGSVPNIDVVEAPRPQMVGAPWWLVGVIAVVAFGLGVALGVLIG